MNDFKSYEFDMYVASVGEPDWPRFQVKNGKGMYWNGRVWVKNQKDGLLYYWHQDAGD